MKIIHTEASCGWGGQEIRILTEAQGMIKRGHTVELLCPEDSVIYRESDRYGVTAISLDIRRKNLTGLFRVWSYFKKHGSSIDVVNTHSSTDSWLVALAFLFVKHPPGLVRTRHLSTRINKKWSTYWLYQKAATHIVVTGAKLKEQLINENHFSPNKITSVPTGIDLGQYMPTSSKSASALGLSEGFIYVGILATLRDWKGHEDLFDALGLLKNDFHNLRCLVVGDGPYHEKLVEHAESKGILALIDFVGHQENPVPWLQAMSIFVLPSWGDEGVSQSLMQAMACALPVICTDVGSQTEVIDHGVSGLIVGTRKPSEVAQAIKMLLENEDYSKKLAARARQVAIDKCGIDLMLDRMEKIFLSSAPNLSN